MSDQMKARIRTWWPMALGALAAWILVQAAPVVDQLAAWGITVTEPQVAAVLAILLGAAVYEGGRWLERRRGEGRWARLARAAGRWLLSLGLHTGQPTYDSRPSGIRAR